MSAELMRFAGWSAYASAAAAILGLVFIGLFFSVGEPFGSLNDIAITLQVLFLLPVTLALRQPVGGSQPTLYGLAAAALVAGALLVTAGSLLLVFDVITFEQSVLPVYHGFGLAGVWLAVGGYLGLRSHQLAGGPAWAGILTGAGFILMGASYWMGGRENPTGHPLVVVGGLLGYLGQPVWAIWLGRLLLADKLAGVG